jgi:hypothetical protein
MISRVPFRIISLATMSRATCCRTVPARGTRESIAKRPARPNLSIDAVLVEPVGASRRGRTLARQKTATQTAFFAPFAG